MWFIIFQCPADEFNTMEHAYRESDTFPLELR